MIDGVHINSSLTLGEDVADILGRAFSGIYHIEREVLHRRVKWESESCILITIRRELSTHDGDELMKLVVGCADRGIRFALRGAPPEYLRLQFTRGRLMFFGTVKAMHEVLT